MGKKIAELCREDRPQDNDGHRDAGLPKVNPFLRGKDGKTTDTMPYQCP
jgi:hypothetical protein